MTAVAPRRSAARAGPPTGRYLLPPLVVGLLAAAGVVVLYALAVRTPLGQSVDTAAMRGADVHHPRLVEVLNRVLNDTTLASLVLVCVAAAAIGVVRRRLDLAIGAAATVLASNLTAQSLKDHLDRPNLDAFPAPNSFPSGHTTAAASVAFALIFALPHAVRGVVTLIGSAYVAVIAVATVWAEWHRPSDTIAGLLLVLAYGGMAAAAVRARHRPRRGATGRPTRVTTVVLVAVGALAAVAGLVGIAAVAASEKVTPDLVSGRFAFLAGSALIVAAVAGAFLLWVRLAAGDQSGAS